MGHGGFLSPSTLSFIGVVTKASSIVYFFKYNVGSNYFPLWLMASIRLAIIAGMILAPFFAEDEETAISPSCSSVGIVGLLGLYVGAKIISIPLIFVSMAVFGIVPD